jgi:glycosyltransferase involved in cell wall biosynthesis
MSRWRVGIFDSSDGPSGVSRHVESLLAGLAGGGEFDVTLFCREGGPYAARSGVRLVTLAPLRNARALIDNDYVAVDENGAGAGGASPAALTAEERGAASGPHPTRAQARSPRGLKGMARAGWRRMAPAALKLWAGLTRESFAVARALRSSSVDLLHVQVVSSDEAVLAARLARIPHIVGTLHIDSSQSQTRHWLPEFVTTRCLHRAIAVSESTKADWARRTRLSQRKTVVIPNGIDPQRFCRRLGKIEARQMLGLPIEAPVIAAVGRLSVQKGFAYLLDAVARLTPIHPKLTVALAGDGPARAELREQAARSGLADRVRFLGFQADVQPVLDAADVFALPSLWEAMPYALLEAMAAGLPVVASSVAGVPEVVVQDETGLLIPPRKSAALAAALDRLLASPALRDRMGQAARERVVERFNEQNMISQTFELYRELLGPAAQNDVIPAPESFGFSRRPGQAM